MKGMLTTAAATLGVVVALTQLAMPASAQVPAEPFFGRYKGQGISRTPDASFYAFTDRDLDVEIGPDGEGFFVGWTTIIRELTSREPRRRASRVVFDPAGRPGYFRERGERNPIDEGVMRWAHIDGDTLTVHVLAIPAGGGYGLQSYLRELRGDRMFLEFVSVADGRPQRMVSGDLTRE